MACSTIVVVLVAVLPTESLRAGRTLTISVRPKKVLTGRRPSCMASGFSRAMGNERIDLKAGEFDGEIL